jgi:hypothetical protein
VYAFLGLRSFVTLIQDKILDRRENNWRTFTDNYVERISLMVNKATGFCEFLIFIKAA